MGTREEQLAEIWRVAVAHYAGQTEERPAEITGPLKQSNLPIGVQTLKEMFRGGQYKMPMSKFDTEYFLGRFEQNFGRGQLETALGSLKLHLDYEAESWQANLPGLRMILKKWTAKLASIGDLRVVEAQFAADVAKSLTMDEKNRAQASARYPEIPTKRQATITLYDRNPHIAAKALLRAAGRCEGCNRPALFKRASDGTDYLEVHHRLRLADGGPDTLANLTALCPNCHRKVHHG